MTLRVSKAELQRVTTAHLIRDPAFRLLKGMTQDNLNAVVKMVIEARQRAIHQIKVEQGNPDGEPKQLIHRTDGGIYAP